MNNELKQIAEQVAQEWSGFFESIPDAENLVRKNINAAIQEQVTEYALRAIGDRILDHAEKMADRTLDDWIEKGEISVSGPTPSQKSLIEKAFLASESWFDYLLESPEKKLGQVYRLSSVEGVSDKELSTMLNVTVSEIKGMKKKASREANAIKRSYRAFFGENDA